MSAVFTYLTDVDEPPADARPLRAGDRVHLRTRGGTAETEAWSECGRRLGRLPPIERDMLAGLGLRPPLTARVAAVVPRPGTPNADCVLVRMDAA